MVNSETLSHVIKMLKLQIVQGEPCIKNAKCKTQGAEAIITLAPPLSHFCRQVQKARGNSCSFGWKTCKYP